MREPTRRGTSMVSELFWLTFSIATLVLFVPAAIATITTPSDWKAGYLDFRAWEAEVPTWLALGMNCLLALLALTVGVLCIVQLFRRLRTEEDPEAEAGAH